MSDFLFMLDVLKQLAVGIPLTLQLAFCALTAGLLCGLCIALAAISRQKGIRFCAWLYVEIIRSTPLLVLMFLIYYGLSQFSPIRQSLFWPVLQDPWWCALLALVINTSAYTSEIIRGGLLSVPRGAREAGMAYGMSSWQLFCRITLPVAIRQALPAYGNEIMLMVKGTSLASLVTLMEVTGIASTIVSDTYRPLLVFFTAGLIYFAINAVLTRCIMWLEHQLNKHLQPQ